MRNLPAGMGDAYSASHVQPILLAQLYFASETVYMWSGIGEIEWDGNVYLGGGKFVGITPIEETQDLTAKGVVATLNGIPADLIALALQDGQTRGRPFRLYLGYYASNYIATEVTAFLTEDDDAIVTEGGEPIVFENGSADSDDLIMTEDGGYFLTEDQSLPAPYRIFSGIMDVPEYSTDGRTADIRLSVENVLIIGQRSKLSRYTNEDQRKLYPLDRGLEFINQLQDKEIVW